MKNYTSIRYLKALRFIVVLFLILNISSFNSKAQALLSDTIDVVNYEIHLEVTNFSSHTISGYTKILLTPQIDSLEFLPFQLWNLIIDSVEYENSFVNSTNIQYDGMDLRIPVSGSLLSSDTVTVTVYYHGTPQVDPTGWGGFLFESTMAYNLGVGFGADPHNLGKTWFPCVDDFIDRASYEYFITTESNKMAVCSGTFYESYSDSLNPLNTIYHWGLNEEIPTYLASIAVSDYVAVHDTFQGMERDIPISIYVRPNYLSSVQGSFINLKPTMLSFENRFGAYKWPRVGYVGTTVGAMEHVSNIAFPNSYINGTTIGETTMAHELAHMWFGNLFTCSSAGDMWINEGWASFCEFIFKEDVHGIDAAKDYIRDIHEKNLRVLHHTDGWITLTNVDHAHTYSTTVYKKGADVIHGMRGYLGDTVFFPTIREVLTDYAFKPISTEELCDAISLHSSVDMTSFFDAYLYEPGWTHFSIDSFTVVPAGYSSEVTVYVRQRLKNKPNFANDNVIDVTFMNTNFWSITNKIQFSGEFGEQTFIIPFEPTIVMLDLEERFSDATTDYYKMVKTTGNTHFEESYFKLQVDQITDSAFIRVEHNWVAPDGFTTSHPEYIISDSRYWKVDGIFPADFEGQYSFYYNNKENSAGWLDYTWFPYPMSSDSLTLLYRSNTTNEWVEIESTKIGSLMYGWLKTAHNQPGEYTLAYRDLSLASIERNALDIEMNIYPNPADNFLYIEHNVQIDSELYIFDSAGRTVIITEINANKTIANIDVSNLTEGVYFVEVRAGEKTKRQKIVIAR